MDICSTSSGQAQVFLNSSTQTNAGADSKLLIRSNRIQSSGRLGDVAETLGENNKTNNRSNGGEMKSKRCFHPGTNEIIFEGHDTCDTNGLVKAGIFIFAMRKALVFITNYDNRKKNMINRLLCKDKQVFLRKMY